MRKTHIPGSYELDYAKIGGQLRAIRKMRKISQTTIARDLGITSAYISAVECGKVKCNLRTLLTYSRICKVPADIFVRIGIPSR